MTTVVTITVLGVLSAAGFTISAALPPQGAGDLPWKDLAGGGAALLMLVAFLLFLRFLSTDRANGVAERAKDRDERAKDREHVERVVKEFRETAQTIHKQCCEAGERRESELHNVIRESRSRGG